MSKDWVDHIGRAQHKKGAERFDELMTLAQKLSDQDPALTAKEALSRASELLKESKEKKDV